MDDISAFLDLNVDRIELARGSWGEQLHDAVAYAPGGCISALLFVLSLPFKLVFALVPPAQICGGWLTFVIALILIGLITAVIGDLANQMGCMMGIGPSITAITFVALGTSLPDTFASMSAARNERYADSSIGNITGSNSVNVFLGLGLPWSAAAIYWALYVQHCHSLARRPHREIEEAGRERCGSW